MDVPCPAPARSSASSSTTGLVRRRSAPSLGSSPIAAGPGRRFVRFLRFVRVRVFRVRLRFPGVLRRPRERPSPAPSTARGGFASTASGAFGGVAFGLLSRFVVRVVCSRFPRRHSPTDASKRCGCGSQRDFSSITAPRPETRATDSSTAIGACERDRGGDTMSRKRCGRGEASSRAGRCAGRGRIRSRTRSRGIRRVRRS